MVDKKINKLLKRPLLFQYNIAFRWQSGLKIIFQNLWSIFMVSGLIKATPNLFGQIQYKAPGLLGYEFPLPPGCSPTGPPQCGEGPVHFR